MAIDWGAVLGGAGQAASAILPYQLSEGAIEDLRGMARDLGARAPAIGQQAASAAEFTPFTVTTGTGTTQIGPGGALTQTLGEVPQAIQSGLLSQAETAMGTTQVTPEQLYSQLQTLRAPSIERQRLDLENRLFAQGRLGTQSGMFGGSTPELLALEESLRQQEAQDLLTSLTQAGALTGQNIQNVQGLLGAAYTPQTQALASLTPALQAANIAQSAGLGQSEALYRGGIAGLEAETAGITGASNLEGQRVRALGDALASFFGASAQAGQESPYSALLEALGLSGGSRGVAGTGISTGSSTLDNYIDTQLGGNYGAE